MRNRPSPFALHHRASWPGWDEKSASPLQVRYSLLPAPWGKLGVAGTAKGLLEIELRPLSKQAFREKLGRKYGSTPLEDLSGFNEFSKRLFRYFEGLPVSFDLPVVLSGLSPFYQKVLKTLRSVSFGRSVTYAGLARRAGFPGAARAVGGACGRNPLPLVIPCHRVLRANGSLGGFSGGLDIKRRLLRIERLEFKEMP